MFFSLKKMEEYFEKDLTVNGTSGGIILGMSHAEGGIKIWQKTPENDGYRLKGEVEGFEYIFNPGASHCFRNIFSSINKYEEHLQEKWVDYEIPNNISLIDARRKFESKFILLDGGFSIINKFSTKCYLQTLQKMNDGRSFKFLDQNTISIIYQDSSPIEIYNSCSGQLEAIITNNG
jgi:hypothetical protein